VKARHTIVQLRGCDDPVVDVKLGDAQVGDEVMGVSDAEFTARVTKGDGTHLSVWKDGALLEQQDVFGDDTTLTFHDTPGAEKHRYRFELVDSANRRLVITSHFYVDGVAGGGGGCNTSGGRTGWLMGVMGVLVVAARRRRARSRR
jgi:MYXO-CTERM domain-containing protein